MAAPLWHNYVKYGEGAEVAFYKYRKASEHSGYSCWSDAFLLNYLRLGVCRIAFKRKRLRMMTNLEMIQAIDTSPRHDIETKTRGEIEAYLSGRGKTRIHEGARNLSKNVSDDYGNRFLVELIQNAHDAHDPDRHDGEIAIVLDPSEGDHGCLYVANRGNGFTKNNLDGITNIALSSKPVNESIGNKGLGFRSVLQICLWPEIYSVIGTGGRSEFDGYCFRFAQKADISTFIQDPGSQLLAVEIFENMPSWYLPVYADTRPGLVSTFAASGFATVLRMPLVSIEALGAVEEQIGKLLELKTPLNLFLTRISKIRIECLSGIEGSLDRHVVERWPEENGIAFERVVIGTDEYLVATNDIEPALFRKHLDESLAKKEVPDAWRDWKGGAQVSVAVRLGSSVENGLLYCFLPLGEEGKAPFSGYINANFYTKMDRRRVDDGIGLNKFFISVAASLCGHAIKFLIDKNWSESPGAVIDLLCWQGGYAQILRESFSNAGNALLDFSLLPCRGADGNTRWVKPSEMLVWDESPDACMSAGAITKLANATLLLDSLSMPQKNSVQNFFLGVGIRFIPTPSTIADWVEKIAQDMHATKADPERWATFYDEVARHLRPDPSALFGKRFLLSVNSELVASEPVEGATKRRRTADIYFPPVMSRDADSDDAETKILLPLEQIPTNLKSGFAFLSRDIAWKSEVGSARTFFSGAKLVREYDTAEVIQTFSAVTQSDVENSTKLQALEWAFRLWSSGRSLSEKETRAANIHVPTRLGWMAAEKAIFGSGWSVPNGKRLEAVLKSGAELSGELASMRDLLLPGFADWPVNHGAERDWVAFLQSAGVRDCLRLIGGDSPVQIDGQPYNLACQLGDSLAGFPESVRVAWKFSLIESSRSAPYSTVQYRSELFPWRLPGLGDFDNFPDEFRKDYAKQVVILIGELKPEHLKFRIFRPREQNNGLAYWPTPLVTLIKTTPWMPVVRGTGIPRYVSPDTVWHFNNEEATTPRFVELVVPSLAKMLSEERQEILQKNFGLRMLNDGRDSISALSIYSDIAYKKLTEPKDVRRFRELFGEVWNNVATLSEGISLDYIPVMVGGQVQVISTKSPDMAEYPLGSVAYFIDEDDSAKKQLLEELGQPFFDFGDADPEETWKWLKVLAPDQFVRISGQALEVHVDGSCLDNPFAAPLLSDIFDSWIVDFIVCAAEHKGGSFFKRTQNNLGKIKRAAMSLRLLTGKRLQISMGGIIRDLPESLRGAVVLRQDSQAVLIAKDDLTTPGLDLLARVSEQLALALQQRDLANGLEASFLRLAKLAYGDSNYCPDDEDIAQALGTSVNELEHTRQYARTDLTSHIRFAVLLAACHNLRPVQEQLINFGLEDTPSDEQVHASLEPLAKIYGMKLPDFVEKLGLVSDLRELIQTFDLPLKILNGAVKKVGGEFQVISNEHDHNRQLKAYISQHNSELIHRLRENYAGFFDRGESLHHYVALRDALPSIAPNPDWFEQYDDLPDELLAAHLDAWMAAQGVSELAVSVGLASLQECRDKNAAQLRNLCLRFGNVLSTWVRHGGEQVKQEIREAWFDPTARRNEFVAGAHKSGWLDFRVLDDASIVKWLELDGLWPVGKPVSADLNDWGLTDEIVQEGKAEVEREREAKRKRRLQLKFGETDFSALEYDYHELIAAVNVGIGSSEALKDISTSFRSLVDVEPSAPGGGSGAGGGAGSGARKSPESSMSDEQKQAVGLVGELWAREWIKSFHHIQHGVVLDDSCWVSRYRDRALGTDLGDDFLGYDFIVRLKKVTYYYEVKASTGDPQAFEMGPTEIGAAQKYKADKDNKFRILYVANATDPKRVSFTLLPNPFSREGTSKLNPVGRGSVTYKFGINTN